MKELYFALLFLFIGCSKDSTPELVLKEFIQYRFESGQSKKDILEMTTGQIHQKISKMSEEDLKNFINVKDLKKRRLKILVKNCEEEICYLTYVLRYVQGSEIPKDFTIEVKKIAQINKVDKKWLLSEVSNIKTYIEAKKELKIEGE